MKDTLRDLGRLGMKLELVQTEQRGTLHYKDDGQNRLILFPDGSYSIETGEPRLDQKAMERRYTCRRFRENRSTHALIHCREDYLRACWDWLYGLEVPRANGTLVPAAAVPSLLSS